MKALPWDIVEGPAFPDGLARLALVSTRHPEVESWDCSQAKPRSVLELQRSVSNVVTNCSSADRPLHVLQGHRVDMGGALQPVSQEVAEGDVADIGHCR